MGIRFACHSCGKRLNIKADLAGKRGICPECSERFRIPLHDAETSTPISNASSEGQSTLAYGGETSQASTAGTAVMEASEPESEPISDSQISSSEQVTPPPPDRTDAAAMHDLVDQSSTWYVRPPSGGQYGPADGPTMRQWIIEGRVSENAMIWRDGWSDWCGAAPIVKRYRSEEDFDSQAPPAPHQEAIAAQDEVIGKGANSQSGVRASGATDSIKDRAVLATNKNKKSKKRVTMSVTLGLVFLLLVVVLVVVLTKS